jgi:hypothetical protein
MKKILLVVLSAPLSQIQQKLTAEGITQQRIAAIHVETGKPDPTVQVHVLPRDMSVQEKQKQTSDTIQVAPGYVALRAIFNPANDAYVVTGERNLAELTDGVLNGLVNLAKGINDAKNGQPTKRLHLVANLEATRFRINGNGAWTSGTCAKQELNVMFLDFDPRTGIAYGFRGTGSKFNEVVSFAEFGAQIKRAVHPEAWKSEAFSAKGGDIFNGGRIKLDNKGNVMVDLTMTTDPTAGGTRSTPVESRMLTVYADGEIRWGQPTQKSALSRLHFGGNDFGLVEVDLKERQITIVPPTEIEELAASHQCYTYGMAPAQGFHASA